MVELTRKLSSDPQRADPDGGEVSQEEAAEAIQRGTRLHCCKRSKDTSVHRRRR